MYQDPDYMDRCNFQSILSYLRTGSEPDEEMIAESVGTPRERAIRQERRLIEELCRFRDKVLAFDWDGVDDDNERKLATDDMWQGVFLALSAISDLDYEMGFRAAFSIIFGYDIGNERSDTLKIENTKKP